MDKTELEIQYRLDELRRLCAEELQTQLREIDINSPPLSIDQLERYLTELRQARILHLL